MKTKDIAQKIENISDDLTGSAWGFEFLKCYQGKDSKLPASTFDRVKSGSSNFAEDKENEILWKKRIYFKWVDKDIRTAFEEAKESTSLHAKANKPMFIIIASSDEVAAYDMDQGESMVVSRDELSSHAYFFLPFAGKKKITVSSEALEVDVKATRKMAVLFDEIRKDNPSFANHDLNVFLARILFCFFAEDTGIFEKDIFTISVGSHTDADGNDMAIYLTEVFRRFRTQDESGFRKEYQEFKYVNGGLFETEHSIPTFSKKSRALLIENGEMEWKNINPDIFGSMFQSIIDPEKRHELGMHYTSRENIMKVISPLFLDELLKDLEAAKISKPKLDNFHNRLTEMKIFDPACGSGNFLILAYEKLRELEMEIYDGLAELDNDQDLPMPRININQFYGIEIDDFAHELAMLALWIKEHQMNMVFHERFKSSPEALPLREGAQIKLGNAARCDWEDVCPRVSGERQNEIYVLGNPPYLGSSMQDKDQKKELATIAIGRGLSSYKNLDYISCWFFKATDYLTSHPVKAAFVSTNSVSQGEHTALLWRSIVEDTGVEIGFAYDSFKWKNSAIGNAGVTCTIVGLRNLSTDPKWIIGEEVKNLVSNIGAYLKNLDEVWIYRQDSSISNLSAIKFGSKPTDGSFLNFDQEVYETLKKSDSVAIDYTKAYWGADEFLKKKQRYCLWIPNDAVDHAKTSPFIRERLQGVATYRAKPKNSKVCQSYADRPHLFLQRAHQESESIIFPAFTSEKREYIPLGFLDENTVISNKGYAVYDAQPWIFGVISSKMHMEWTQLVSGRLETRIGYSSFVYNNFPIPPLSDEVKEEIEEAVFEIIDIREEYHEMTYGDMYDPDKMPANLLTAHQALDAIVDRCYQSKPFTSVQDRLEHLIKLYKSMTAQD